MQRSRLHANICSTAPLKLKTSLPCPTASPPSQPHPSCRHHLEHDWCSGQEPLRRLVNRVCGSINIRRATCGHVSFKAIWPSYTPLFRAACQPGKPPYLTPSARHLGSVAPGISPAILLGLLRWKLAPTRAARASAPRSSQALSLVRRVRHRPSASAHRAALPGGGTLASRVTCL